MKLSTLKIALAGAVFMAAMVPVWAQSCETRDEAGDSVKSSLQAAAKQLFEEVSAGDLNGLRANTLPAEFNGITSVVNDNKAALAGGRAQIRTYFLLDTGQTPSPDGRFYCGVFGASGMSSGSAEFDLPGLPAGKYAVVIQDVQGGGKGPYAVGAVFQDAGGWKLAGLQIRPETAMGHDGLWYLKQARDYKSKSQNHNAWFYYLTSWELLAPVSYMDSSLLSKIVQESNGIQPKDVPSGSPVNFSANGKTYSITQMNVYRSDKSFDLSLTYSVPSTTDFAATAAEARNLGSAFVAQYPEVKEAFSNVWVHAKDANGGDVPGVVVLKPATP
ncbi:MAG TPA: hypothetical protein VKW06_18555 [Candidatus Angelobacter sp.]|nr:hypothetical protein [Candidatus Angelobacter sp.]